MQNLLNFLAKYHHWLIFLLLEVVSVTMLFKYNSYQCSVWISSANTVAGHIYEWQSGMEQYLSLKQQNEQLTRRNLELTRRNNNLRQNVLRLSAHPEDADRAEFDSLSQYMLIEGRVVHSTTDRTDNLITINRGTADGVQPDMGVASGLGIVGVVYQCSSHYSVVLPVINPRSRVSCAIRGKDYFGYLGWDGGNPRYAYVEGIPRHAKFSPGEWIETNGYSAIFPAGITVGQIVSIQDSPDGMSYRLKVQLATDFTCLRDVCVISDKSFIEQSRLLQMARDSLEIMKNQNK